MRMVAVTAALLIAASAGCAVRTTPTTAPIDDRASTSADPVPATARACVHAELSGDGASSGPSSAEPSGRSPAHSDAEGRWPGWNFSTAGAMVAVTAYDSNDRAAAAAVRERSALDRSGSATVQASGRFVAVVTAFSTDIDPQAPLDDPAAAGTPVDVAPVLAALRECLTAP